MKITNNEIVVELPPLKDLESICYMVNNSPEEDQAWVNGYNRARIDTKNLNPPRIMDVEALAKVIFYDKYPWATWGNDSAESKSWEYNCIKQAQHLVSNLDKWLVEKKEDRTV